MSESSPDTTIDSELGRPRWRPQMSLATLLCLMAIFAIGLSHYLQAQKFQKFKDDHEALRKKMYIPKIKDPEVIYAVGLPAYGRDLLRCRLYLPPNKNYVFHCATKEIPKEGFDAPKTSSMEIPPGTFSDGIGELWVEVFDNQIDVLFPKNSCGFQYSPGQPVQGEKTYETFSHIEPKFQTDGEKGKPFELERRRRVYVSPKAIMNDSNLPERTDGILIWIEEAPKANPAG